MNSKNSKAPDPHRLLLNLANKIDLRRKDKYIALSNLSIYYTWKSIKKPYKNNKFKISAPTQNEEFELPDGSYSISDIQDYFEYILKNMEKRQLILQLDCMQTKQKTESRLKLKQDIFLNFQLLKQ